MNNLAAQAMVDGILSSASGSPADAPAPAPVQVRV